MEPREKKLTNIITVPALKEVKLNLEQEAKTLMGSSCIALLFL
jgi:hypothetical protein